MCRWRTFGAPSVWSLLLTSTNAGLLYTAKGTAGLLVPIASLLVAETGNWHLVFLLAAAMNALAAALAILLLRPMRLAMLAQPRLAAATP